MIRIRDPQIHIRLDEYMTGWLCVERDRYYINYVKGSREWQDLLGVEDCEEFDERDFLEVVRVHRELYLLAREWITGHKRLIKRRAS